MLEKMAGRLIETGALILMLDASSRRDRDSVPKLDHGGSWML
jgi:hypothetical protein